MLERLQGVYQAAGALAWSVVLALRWIHAQFIAPAGTFLSDTLLPVYEESVKAFVRESFAVLARSINTFSAFLLALVSGSSYRRTAAHNAAAKQQAWHRWWSSAHGTFNALVEQEGLAAQGGGEAGRLPSSPATPSFRQAPSLPASTPRSSSGRSWRFWRRQPSGGSGQLGTSLLEPPSPRSRAAGRGSLLFDLPSGFGVSQMVSGRGLLEDLRLGSEVAVGRAFGAVGRAVRMLLLMDIGSSSGSSADSPADLLARGMRRREATPPLDSVAEGEEAAAAAAGAAAGTAAGASAGAGATAPGPAAPEARAARRRARRPPLRSLLRSGRHWEEDLSVWTASDVILREGYPLEQHSVTTQDGYVLQVHRIPRHGARDVAYFQHGVLDTSLGWVSNGVVGSAAFAAYDAGFDVWLGNSRSNAPRLHTDAGRQGSRYWAYTINELGCLDIAAAITHIHNTKMAELAAPGRHAPAAPCEAPTQRPLRRVGSDSALDALRWVDVRSGSSSRGGLKLEAQAPGPQGAAGGGEQQAQQAQQPPRAVATLRRSQSAPRLLEQGGDRGQAVPLRMQSSSSGAAGGAPAKSGSSKKGSSSSSSASKAESTEARSSGSGGGGGSGAAPQEVLPYRLQAVGHSLGAASLMMYAVVCRMRGQPHYLRRLVLMSPAGFHPKVALGMRPCSRIFPPLVWLLDRLPGLRGRGMGLRLPSPLLRYVTFKFTQDLRHMPALHDLVRAGMRTALSGDSSQWDAALTMPHYSTFSMPALSLHCGAHFAQWANDPYAFRLFDYGTAAANRARYGSDRPPSLADHYQLLDVPVDLLAGAADGVIPPACVVRHAQVLRSAGVPCSFRILPYGHMDFTFAVRDDIRMYVLAKLRHPLPA